MSAAAQQRGQPLLVLATILGGWTVMRVLLWSSPFPLVPAGLAPGGERSRPVAQWGEQMANPPASRSIGDHAASLEATPWTFPPPLPAPMTVEPGYPAPEPGWSVTPVPAPPVAPEGAERVRRIGGQYMLLAAGLSSMALPPEVAAVHDRARPGNQGQRLTIADRPLLGTAATPEGSPRWSADGWLLWRRGSGASAAPGAASYGRSQAGAVVRYRLAEGAAKPQAFARVTHTLEGPDQGEVAAGLSLRPVPGLPVRLAAEGRVTDSSGRREVRPAMFAVTELAPARLPLGLRGEGYAQAGYVGGRDATAFVDGQARLDGQLARLGEQAEMRLGLAAWGGAQKGAARLDIGPSATLGFRIGNAPARAAVDYRVRVAGAAEPGSGPALTFSAGF